MLSGLNVTASGLRVAEIVVETRFTDLLHASNVSMCVVYTLHVSHSEQEDMPCVIPYGRCCAIFGRAIWQGAVETFTL